MQYPALNPFYFCDAITELIDPQRSSATSILTAMVNWTPTLSMMEWALCSSYQAEQRFQDRDTLFSRIVSWKITDLVSNFYSESDEREIST